MAGVVALSIRSRGQDIVLAHTAGERKVRGIVGFAGDEDAFADANAISTNDLTITLAAEDALGVASGDTASYGGATRTVRGVVPQGLVTKLLLRDVEEGESE